MKIRLPLLRSAAKIVLSNDDLLSLFSNCLVRQSNEHCLLFYQVKSLFLSQPSSFSLTDVSEKYKRDEKWEEKRCNIYLNLLDSPKSSAFDCRKKRIVRLTIQILSCEFIIIAVFGVSSLEIQTKKCAPDITLKNKSKYCDC